MLTVSRFLFLQVSPDGRYYVTQHGVDNDYDIDFVMSQMPSLPGAFGHNCDKALQGMCAFVDKQQHGEVLKRHGLDGEKSNNVAHLRAAPPGSPKADFVAHFDAVMAFCAILAAATGCMLDSYRNVCIMLSGPFKHLVRVVGSAKVSDHTDHDAYRSGVDRGIYAQQKILIFSGSDAMGRHLVLVTGGRVIGGLIVQAGDVVVSGPAFRTGNGMGIDGADIKHGSRLENSSITTISGLTTAYLFVEEGKDIAELLARVQLPPAAATVFATAATLHALAATPCVRLEGTYTRLANDLRLLVIPDGLTYELIREVMDPFLLAVEYDKRLIHLGTGSGDLLANQADLSVRAVLFLFVELSFDLAHALSPFRSVFASCFAPRRSASRWTAGAAPRRTASPANSSGAGCRACLKACRRCA